MKLQEKYYAVGLMSGTSLDGLDIALCCFEKKSDKWFYSIIDGATIGYDSEWKNKLSVAHTLTGFELVRLHKHYGSWIGEQVNVFLQNKPYVVDFVASHGHTVLHQPQIGITFQIGDGANIAAATRCTTVCDFRSGDVALGGQGAPLVPIGDQLLFSDYDACLNLGGFANISYQHNDKRLAFDICAVNIVINKLVEEVGKTYDRDGLIAQQGSLNNQLLKKLNSLDFYTHEPPKSLGREWVEQYIYPLLSDTSKLDQRLHTFYHHVTDQIALSVAQLKGGKILVTGGGAYNKFLITLLQQKTHHNIVVPEAYTVEFKEALVFAFLGLLRLCGEANCLRSVTGASTDNVGGAVYSPIIKGFSVL